MPWYVHVPLLQLLCTQDELAVQLMPSGTDRNDAQMQSPLIVRGSSVERQTGGY